MSLDVGNSRFKKLLETNEPKTQKSSSRKLENRERAEKLLRNALQGAQQAAQGPVGSQHETSSVLSPMAPMSPLGDFASDLGPTGMTAETQGQETDSKGIKGLDSRFSNNIERMMQDAPGNLTIYSGRRETSHQKELWDKALEKYGSESAARKWVAPPTGTRMSDGSIAKGSRHESGIAADLKYADDATKRWVHENAHRYGLHFPLNNEDWHIEPLGSR